MLGGGTFTDYNEGLPGTYINIISASRTAATADRGTVTMPLILDWGQTEKVFKVTNEDFEKSCLELFGYSSDHEKMKGLRDLFKNAKILYAYRIIKGGVAATNKYATAKYPGIRGNDIRISVSANIDDATKKDVTTYVDDFKVDRQAVSAASDLHDNSYVTFKKDATLATAAGEKLIGGANGDAVTGTEYQGYLDAVEPYSFTAMGCITTDTTVKSLFTAYTRRMSEEIGAKFQCVLYKHPADYEGVISVENKVLDSATEEPALVYWVLGAEGGCAINKSVTNKVYDGEYTIDVSYTQKDLEESLIAGKFVFHNVGEEIRVLKDINTLTTFTEAKGAGFSSNETIRVVYQIATEIANLFNTKYLGSISNDEAGRISLWADIVENHQEMQKINAITGFTPEDVVIDVGKTLNSVVVSDFITVMKTMEQLYMTVVVQ